MKVKLLTIVILTLLLPVGMAHAEVDGVQAGPTDPGWDPQAGGAMQPEDPGAGILAATVWVDDDTYDATTCTAAGHTWGFDCTNTIQGGISLVNTGGGTIYLAAGDYVETGQIAIGKNLSIVGAGADLVTIQPAQNTGSSGDARGWWLVGTGYTFNLSGVTLDGQGWNIMQGIRSFGSGTIDDIVIQNITYPGYNGLGISLFGNMTVSNSSFSNIGRVGVIAFGAGCTTSVISGNTYTGKGDGNWLDYAVEVGGGAVVTISNNIISGNTGVASSDGSTSAGILVTTYFGGGTQATITGNTLTGNTTGIAVGYDGSDTSVVIAHGNSIYGNLYGVSSTAPAVDAENNYWGTVVYSEIVPKISGDVDWSPWCNSDFTACTYAWPVHNITQGIDYQTIQAAVDDAHSGDKIQVDAGTYVEYVTINQDLTLTGAPGATIQKPAGDVYYKLPDEGTTKSFRPIVLAYGGSITGGDGTSAATAFTIQGTGTANVTISGFAVKANNAWTGATSTNFADGILLRNVVGTVSSNTIDDMLPSDANQFTLGIEVRGDNSNVTISGNTVTEYGRVGIFVAGNVGTPIATVAGNTVTAVYFGSYVTNGIEINYRSTGTVSNNTVTGASGAGTIWSGACIMVTDADNVTISQNNVSDCEIGIAVGGRLNYGYVALNNVIEGNTLDSCLYSAIEIDTNSQNTTIRNNTITGVAARAGTEEAGIVVLEYSNPLSGYPNGVLIEGNSISGDAGFWGIDIYRNADNVTIQNNTITGGAVGVALELKEANSLGKTITIGGATGKANSFTGQTVLAVSTGPYDYSGVIYQWTPDVNASANWWGTNTPAGVAALVSANVDYTPWLAVGTDTSANPGFQGDFTTLWVEDDSPQTGTTGRIQEGIDLVSDSTVNVAPGTYAEDLVIDKSIDLLCPNVGIDPNTGTRVDEAIIMPATEGSTTWGMIVDLQASNVTLDGCTFDGDNPLLTGGTPLGAADINTNAAIDNSGYYDLDHLRVQNNIIRNFLYSSIYVSNTGGAKNGGNYIVHNLFDNMWEGIQLVAADTDISNNVFSNVTRGVGLHSVISAPDAGFVPQIANNVVNVVYNWTSTSRNVGIWVNGRSGTAAPFSVSNNTINTPNAMTGYEYWGYYLQNVTGDRALTFSGNTVNGGGNCDVGLRVVGLSSSAPVVATGGGLYNIKTTGVYLNNYTCTTGWGCAYSNTALTLDGSMPITMSPAGSGTVVLAMQTAGGLEGGEPLEGLRNGKPVLAPDHNAPEATVTSLTVTGGTYSDAAIGIDVDGATANVSGATISNNGTGVYIHNSGTGAFTDNCISGSASYGMNNTTGVVVDAVANWWGDGSGPYHAIMNPTGVGDDVSDDVAFAPWISDMCHGTVTAGHWLNLRTGVYSTLASSVAAAAPGDTIQGTCPDGTTIPGGGTATVANVTIDLNGCTVGPGPSFLIVNAADVTVLGPGVIDGWDGSANSPDPAIRVLAGADNFILKGVEIQRWASGVSLEGSVLSFKIGENFIHNNTGAGLVVGSGVTLSGVVTIEGNLFKDNGGSGVEHNGSGTLPAAYNSWGDLAGPAGPLGDGVGSNVTYIPWTFAEIFLDMYPNTEAVVHHVVETTSFDVALKADAAKLYGLAFRFSYDNTKLTLNSTTFSAPWAGRCTALPLLDPDEIGYFCSLLNGVPPDPEWDADGGTIATFNFTALSGAPGNGPWTALFDISPVEFDTEASAIGGQKVFINNAGFNAPTIPNRDITDEDDGQIIIERAANYTGFVNLQGRLASNGLAVCRVYNQAAKAGAVELANGTGAPSGAYTTAHLSPYWLAYGNTYYIVIDRWLFLPTTPAEETSFRHSRLLDTTPLTSLPNVFLLGGDATNDEIILINDLSCIGGDYGKTSGFRACGGTGLSDVNEDGAVTIQDLSLAGGNFYKTFSPWTVP